MEKFSKSKTKAPGKEAAAEPDTIKTEPVSPEELKDIDEATKTSESKSPASKEIVF